MHIPLAHRLLTRLHLLFHLSAGSLSTRPMDTTLYFHYWNYFPTTMTTLTHLPLNAWPEDERDRKRAPFHA